LQDAERAVERPVTPDVRDEVTVGE